MHRRPTLLFVLLTLAFSAAAISAVLPRASDSDASSIPPPAQTER